MKCLRPLATAAAAVLGLAAFTAAASAQSVADFYKGKTVSCRDRLRRRRLG